MNRIHLASWVACLALAVAAGCQRVQAPEEFPQGASDGWLAAFNSGDPVGLALMYSEDALLLPYDRPSVSGHGAIEAFWDEYNPGQVRIAVSGVNTERAGKYWFREGTYSAMYPDEGEPRVGKFMELWVQSGSNWMLYRQMWSPNAPEPALLAAPAPAPAA